MSAHELRCRDLQSGDIFLKVSDQSLLSGAIQFGQSLAGGKNTAIVHAGIMFDSTYAIESQGPGITANDMRVQNSEVWLLRLSLYQAERRARRLRALTLGKLLSAFGETLFEASGGRTPASFDNLRTLSFWGHDEKGGFHLLREALGAGAGARMEGDGASAVPPLGATGGMPVEVMEARYPVRVESMGLAQDSGGAGARRGGLGVFREYRMLIDGVSASAAGSAEAGPAGRAGRIARKTLRDAPALRQKEHGGTRGRRVHGVSQKAIRSASPPPAAAVGAIPPSVRPRTCGPTFCAASSRPKAAESAYGVVLGGAPGFRDRRGRHPKTQAGKIISHFLPPYLVDSRRKGR